MPRDVQGGEDFSLVLGGPLFQLLRRTHLSDAWLGLAPRRVLFAILLLWAPLLALSALDGGLIRPGRATPFLEDIGFQLRFLVVAPVLIVAEVVVHRRLKPLVDQFHARGLVRPADADRFDDALADAVRRRNSLWTELALLAVVYVVGLLFTLQRYQALGRDAWYAPAGGGAGLSLAGYWLVFVSLPLFQFLLLRWYMRLGVWALFLWRVARLDLDLQATHPDRMGGLGFLSASLNAFVPLAIAHGVLLAGVIADRIFFAGARLPQFQVEVIVGAALVVAVFAGPLIVFAPRLAQVKRAGLLSYGGLGQTYVRDFRAKWLAAGAPEPGEPLVGSGDIQSLADFGNSYANAEQMRVVPIRNMALVWFVVSFLAPIAPLALTMMSLDALVKKLVSAVF